jgi:hypothetical protein
MLSGVQDEVVPKEHMRGLWEIVTKRGEKKSGKGSPAASTDDVRIDKVVGGMERAKYMEFPAGTHSECLYLFRSRSEAYAWI